MRSSSGQIGLGPAAIVAAGVAILCALPGAAQEADTTEVDPVPEGFIDLRAGVVDVEEVVTEGDLPVAGFEPSPVNGAFLQSADGTFRLQFGAFAQVRWTALDNLYEQAVVRYDSALERIYLDIGYGEEILASNISSFSLTFYDSAGNTTATESEMPWSMR